MKEICFFILAYILGSIPFGFIFSKILAKKDPLKVGWRKTSGSNVFYYVSKPAGILTGIFDVFKGSLAVFLAKNFGLSPFSQAICGLFAIFGHNWSIFLKFAGGRGIGTFLGGLLILDPKILLYLIFPTLFLVLILNSPLASIFLFLFCAIFSIYFQNFPVLFFSLFSLIPIFLKRLSPISELSFENFKNRILYDQDQFLKTGIEKWILKK